MSRTAASTEFSESVKRKIREGKDEGWCIACERIEGVDYCHIIGQKDPEYSSLYEKGIVNFASRANEDNGVMLCCSCHRGFDKTFPTLYIVPYNIQWFIRFEQENYAERENIFRITSEQRRRLVPSSAQYSYYLQQMQLTTEEKGPLYHVILRKPIHDSRYFKVGVGIIPPAVHWRGSPTALLRHAFKLLQGHSELWIPGDLAANLYKLMELYNRPEPWELKEPKAGGSDIRAGGFDGGSSGGAGAGVGGGTGFGFAGGKGPGGERGPNTGGTDGSDEKGAGAFDVRETRTSTYQTGYTDPPSPTPIMGFESSLSVTSAPLPKLNRWSYGPQSSSEAKRVDYNRYAEL